MKLMILDGNSIINRAFYGIRALTTRDGLFTNAIYGFLNILHRMEQEEHPDALCVAFDLPGPTFRHLQYDGYKANRHGMPEELAMQMPVMKEVLAAMRIPIYECQGWEADDVIGTVGSICREQDCRCVIVTGDRDSLQLVNDRVSVKLVTSKAGQTLTTLYTPEVFQAEYGFAPIHLIDLKALMGDSSDNIPGVPGVGPKTATELLLKFGTLAGIYEHISDPSIKEGTRKKLQDGKESAELSYDLATIRCNAPITFAPQDAVRRQPDKPALRELFLKLEFVRLMDRYDLQNVQQELPVTRTEIRLCDRLPTDVPFAVYIEGERAAAAWDGGVWVTELEQIRPFCANDTPKVCSDLKSLYKQADCNNFIFDVSLAAYVLDATLSDFSVEHLAAVYLSQTLAPDDLAGKAAAIWALKPILLQKLTEQGSLSLYETVELPLCRVLHEMECAGVTVDQNALTAFGKMLTERIDAAQDAVYAYAGEEFNINSTKALGEILFEKLGLPPVKKTKTGYSTNAEVLEKLRSKHPIVDAILDYRMLTKLSSTYAEGLLKYLDEESKIHTTFQNMVTNTGRLSSTDPNLQNIPVRRELGSEIRKMFVAKKGNVLVDADYSQIELRVLAHIADDAAMQQAFESGQDIHAVTASQVFGVPLEAVTPEMRRNAKAVNFGIVYGISAWSLSQDIGVSQTEAKRYIQAYLEKYSGIGSYMKKIVEQAKKDGCVSTIYGRRRYLPELKSSNFNLRSFGERVALNAPIQGTAADIIKLAMLRVDRAIRAAGLRARLILQVHDELIVECPEEEAAQVRELLTREMEQAASLRVPLAAEAGQGGSWYEAK